VRSTGGYLRSISMCSLHRGLMSNLRLDVAAPVMAVCGVIFIGAIITWLWRARRMPSGSAARRLRAKANKATATTLLASGAVLVAGAVYLPTLGSEPSLVITLPARAGPGDPAFVGCGPVPVHVSGPDPSGETLVLASLEDDVSASQVESDVSWDPALKQWTGRVTFADSWPRGQSAFELTAYLMSQQWVAYIRTARNLGTGNTWWWQSEQPPQYSGSAEIPVHLVRHPDAGQAGKRC
jgi:hypothetical protein